MVIMVGGGDGDGDEDEDDGADTPLGVNGSIFGVAREHKSTATSDA